MAVTAFWLVVADFSAYKADIERVVSEATGRDFRIDGTFELRVFPPSLIAEDISYANADWGADAAMLTLRHLSVKIDGGSLFAGPILVTHLRLEDVKLILERNEAGTGNWVLHRDAPTERSLQIEPHDGLPVILEHAVISNVTVTARSRDADDKVYAIETLTVGVDARRDLLAHGNGTVEGEPLTLSARLGPVANFRAGDNLHLDVTAEVGATSMRANLGTLDGVISVAAHTSALDELAGVAGIHGAPAGEASVKGDVVLGRDSLALVDFNVNTSVVELTTTLQAQFRDGGVTVDPFSLQLGESGLAGTLSVGTGESPSIVGDVRAKLIDLTPYRSAGEPETSRPEPGALMLSEDPLPLGYLHAGNLDLKLLMESFVLGQLQLQQVDVAVKLVDGELALTGGADVPGGGKASAAVALVSQSDAASADLDLQLVDFRLGRRQEDQDSPDELPRIDLDAGIKTEGASMHDLAANANGRILLTQGPGRVDHSVMDRFSADILSELITQLNPFARKDPHANWECTVVGVDIVDGVATLGPALAQSEKVTIVAKGNVDLNNERLNVRFNTKPRRGVGVTADMFVTPFIQLGGTMSAPHLTLDKKGALITGGVAALTGGVSLLVQGAADRATGARDRCAQALAIAKGKAAAAGE